MMHPNSNGESPASSTSNEHAADHLSASTNTSRGAGPSSSKDQNTKEQRVPLACLRCRAKRARCSGIRPRCKACENADVECQWPEGRRRKRTRREMEEAERVEREAAAAAAGPISEQVQSLGRHPSLQVPSPDQHQHHHHHQQSIHRMPIWEFNTNNMAHEPDASLAHAAPPNKQWEYPVHQSQPSYIWPPPQNPPPSSMGVASGPSPSNGDYASEFLAGSGVPPTSNAQLMRALQTQTAFVEGDPDSKEDLELYYYRFSGSTAIHPGINRISLKLQSRPTTGPQPSASAPVPSGKKTLPTPANPEVLFDQNGMPLPSVYIPLLDTFFRTMSQHFPSISRKRMGERLETGTMSAFLLNCICAIAARFHPAADQKAAEACAPFITKAQELIVPLLHLPAHDSVTGLLLLAWACYGQNSEAALWQYSGMAFRMSFDLGLHEVSEIYENSAHVVRTRLLFWSLFITDRIISFSTGRPNSIPEEAIEIPLPADEDFFPDPARNTDPNSLNEPVEPIPFQYLVRVQVLCGRISTVLNGQRGRPRTLVGSGDLGPTVLSELQTQLVQFYATLPDPMKWSVENFKHQEVRGHGSTFLTLHLWTNAVMALVYHPELTVSPSGTETPFTQSMQRSMRLSLSSSRNISECLVFADLFSSQAYLGSPFSVQPIYVACLAFIHEMKRNAIGQNSLPSDSPPPGPEEPPMAEAFMTSIARQNLSILTKAIQRMEQLWAGIAYVSNILEQRAAGLAYSRIKSDVKTFNTFISLPDKGLLRRYSGNDLPHNTAPATETSLRTSIENEAMAASPFSVQDLLSSYSIQDLLVQPADNYDLEQLLATGSRADGRIHDGHRHGDGTGMGVQSK